MNSVGFGGTSGVGVSPIAARRPERWAAARQENVRRTRATEFATELGSMGRDGNGRETICKR
jgi:hypothetical protein